MKLADSKAEYDKVGDEIYRLRDEKQNKALHELQCRVPCFLFVFICFCGLYGRYPGFVSAATDNRVSNLRVIGSAPVRLPL